MSDRTISVTISDEEQAFLEREIANGNFADEGEVVRAAIARLEHETKLNALRRDVQKGLDDFSAGRYKTFNEPGDMARYVIDNADALK
ncbi:putative addiction module CopG family antidote [Rhizobium sp. SG_E_25_P2]|jgi:putative addiction module CopG family antidote|uniref:type II toxin-antitoxin system ParD family antitoxin n=1 Tax=Rhizobium sp. SG_E_25_P2 TaxID=2879942 RepID=UPI0024742A3A|nr:type II toxin-antitoxin system ParD family antitoxin [Rhizobium sp. SG_E_25_P2]MDH6266835.1 putative addiction module CopG family antidote [Rhizobium sp. SG_E_25_P2]